jgi:hypothetical protein
MSRTLSLFALSLLVVSVAEGKKKKEEAPPPVGWHKVEATKKDPGWRGECYYPPEFEGMDITDRRMARQVALQEMKKQWLGQRDEIVSFDARMIDDVETVLLGRPDDIEQIARKNAELCEPVMAAGGDTGSWSSWLGGLPAKLTAGECNTPLDYQLIQYLDLGKGWQEQIPMCQGDRAIIQASSSDKYRVVQNGEWINADGDLSQPSTDPSMPCNFEGCFVGMLIGRFVTDAGIETIFPIGTEKLFEAPEHGTFSFTVNDTTAWDNEWHSSGTITDHTAVTVSPADDY